MVFLRGPNRTALHLLGPSRGITDPALIAGHLGLGIDYFINDRLYFLIDARMGPALLSADPARDPETGSRNFDFHLEGALSFGLGMMFGSGSKR